MTTSSREKILAITTAILIVLAVIFMSVIKPQLKRRKELLKQEADLLLLATRTQTNLNLRNRIEQQHILVNPLITSDRTEVLEISAFFAELEALYIKHHLIHTSEKTLPTKHGNAYKLLSIKIGLQGNINHVLRFILSVEAAEAPLGIAKCEIKAQEQRDTVRASITVNKLVAES